ncbi:hypothetical protein GOP47_0020180 [Adiantum capillus-veneris]|uniref:Uncharacterized protein n=1 Tax=Adiantum capillus-veneris TaxID=13818 RepID=A0A9D4Z973_ADICA|nr:hypothetical protein GOP47_0020180 [Adiantum capillus-veneris]
MQRWACKQACLSRLLLHNGHRLRALSQEHHLRWQNRQHRGFCASPVSHELLSEASLGGDVAGDSTVQGRWVAEGEGDGLSSAAVQRRSLRKANTQPVSDLERACIQMLWRRNSAEPIEFQRCAPALSLFPSG